MRMDKMRRSFLAWVLILMLFMSSGLGGVPGAMAHATSEEGIVVADENSTSEDTPPAPAPAEVPAGEPEPAQPEVTPEAGKTVVPEATAEPEETETPTPEPVPAETPAATEDPALEPTEIPSEELRFSEGYVRLGKGSVIYEKARKAEKLGTLKADGIVYAELAEGKTDPAEDWLKITFDTQSLRESDEQFAVGYVQYKAVEALTEEETANLIAELEGDPETRWGKVYVPCVVLEEKELPPAELDEGAEGSEESETIQPEADAYAEAADTLSDVPAATEIIGVWYDKGIEERPLQIHVTTSLDAQYLYLYQGEKLLASWQADEANIDESAASKEWHVSHTFAYSGAYYLWYKASADGTAMSDAYTPAPAQIERPAVIDVWYEQGIEGKPLKIHATTNLAMQHLYLYLGDDQIGSWSAADAEIVEYATCKEWVVEHTFSDPGAYYLWYKASEDGAELSLPYSPAAVQIERPAVIDVWYEKKDRVVDMYRGVADQVRNTMEISLEDFEAYIDSTGF